MIDESIIADIETKGDNFKPLFLLMQNSGIIFKNRRLVGALGLATFDCIYLNMDALKHKPSDLYFFVILHEMAHHKRISKLGKEYFLKLFSDNDFDVFSNGVINEEIIADRYGCYVYKCLTNKNFPIYLTQQLDRKYKQDQYKDQIKGLFGLVKNSENNYIKLMESFLI